MVSIANIALGIKLAWSARFWLLAGWLLILMVSFVVMAAQFSGRQPATLALDVGLSFIRLSLAIFIALLVQELISKEFERRYYLYSLSYPFNRGELIFGRLIASFIIVNIVLVCAAFLLQVSVVVIEQGYAQSRPVSLGLSYWLTIGFLAVDLLVVTVVAIFLAVLAKTPGFVLIGTLGFTLVARSFSSILALLGGDNIVVDNPDQYQSSLSMVSLFLPDLGSLDVRQIALYNDLSFLPSTWPWTLTTVLVYVIVILSLTVWVFNRRRFN